MDKSTEELIKKRIIGIFPKLATDKNFKLTSPINPNYNCLAWACHYNDRWMQPPSITPPPLDSVVYWPEDAKQGMEIECLIDAFRTKGYELCDSWEYEDKYQKVALYVKKDSKTWTHAARELQNGFWTSKLGQGYDIQHGTPFTIEGDSYGEVYCIMKRIFQ